MEAPSIVESVLSEVDRVRRTLKKESTKQVRSVDELSIIKALVNAWFNTYRPKIIALVGESEVAAVDNLYKVLLESSSRHSTRQKYETTLKKLREKLATLRIENIERLSSGQPQLSDDNVPDFSVLISDAEMQAILHRRWNECATCIRAHAPLAAIVMIGGLLEGLLLARINQIADKSSVFKAKTAPKDREGKVKKLQEWGLTDYINVAHELGWISQTEKDLGNVMRDYRNYVHPYKERSEGIKLEPKDAIILWQVSKSIARQLLAPV